MAASRIACAGLALPPLSVSGRGWKVFGRKRKPLPTPSPKRKNSGSQSPWHRSVKSVAWKASNRLGDSVVMFRRVVVPVAAQANAVHGMRSVATSRAARRAEIFGQRQRFFSSRRVLRLLLFEASASAAVKESHR